MEVQQQGFKEVIFIQMGWRDRDCIGNGEVEELICTIHGCEPREGLLEGRGYSAECGKGGKIGATVMA